jgi:hypothetical protein
MVIVGLKGGLGNQLFQYAAAKNIALENQTELLIDEITGFKEDPYNRSFALFDFCIESKSASPTLIKSFKNTSKIGKLFQYKIQKLFSLGYLNFLHERFYHFDNRIANLKIRKNIYLEGYFHSEKYFKSISAQIQCEFEFKNKPDDDSVLYLKKIESANSTSLHIRKYDDTKNLESSSIYGVCSLTYYQKAINYIQEKIPNSTFFIFSDDIEFARNQLIIEDSKVEYVNRKGSSRASEDLRLMASCKNNIIANSTFSWWGAWLNKSPDKIVIAPKQWLATYKYDYKDVVPEDWLKL